ncbi:MAG: thermonuclease family protein [Erysipelotrichaceae bacterium]|nr:thermonuclease family protein [Erysipelotrichaceae bacterium]
MKFNLCKGAIVSFLALATFGLVSCNEKPFIDYVNDGSVQLNLPYEGKDFYTDGVGQVTLALNIDGDTTHFYPVVTTTSSEIIKVRYYGIDTPESTGRVQEWGHTASEFTKERINNANANGTIVVSSAQDVYGVPSHDSTGERYVGLVWINETEKNAPSEDLVLLNLWIVQEGLSWVKNVQEMPDYSDTFYAAQAQAEDFELCLFSDETEPGFNTGDYETTSLLDLKIEMEKSILDPNYENKYDNAKVRVTGTVAGFVNGTMYLVDYYSEENGGRYPGGEWAGINIFCGMSAPSSIYTTVNTYLQICALAQNSETFGFQLTGAEGHFPTVPSLRSDDDALIIYTAAENAETEYNLHTFEYTSSELSTIASNNEFNCLNCAVTVTNPVTVSSFYINTAGDEITLRFTGCSFNVYITNVSWCKFDPANPSDIWNTEEEYMGKSFMISGVYTWHRTTSGNLTFQVTPTLNTSMSWVTD